MNRSGGQLALLGGAFTFSVSALTTVSMAFDRKAIIRSSTNNFPRLMNQCVVEDQHWPCAQRNRSRAFPETVDVGEVRALLVEHPSRDGGKDDMEKDLSHEFDHVINLRDVRIRQTRYRHGHIPISPCDRSTPMIPVAGRLCNQSMVIAVPDGTGSFPQNPRPKSEGSR